MTSISQSKIQPGYEPIAGYVLEEIIGRGGFGEVWRAEAPGGIKKAVKFVFGDRDDYRAEQELKSLERIKAVQHPFILTLERFEVVDDRLVIITEIADGSLDEVFRQRRKLGSCGIARARLLAYMRDTADALDYLHGLYKLQHLDIKPANLLIVGGRVKVADFGLLKDLRDVECSVIGGLTPIYAPPELFDGRPSLHSDQYSLAVMYQELLTGTRPFSGRTIAQLATQHIHNAPNLTSLPPSDRPVVARALEKSPERRFANCTDFVDALVNELGTAKRQATTTDHATETEEPSDVQDLPQFQSAEHSSPGLGVGHALVIGLGGSGADCVGILRRRVAELRSLSPLVLHSVVVDVDATTSLRDDLESEHLAYHLHVTTPLRSAHEYRDRGTDHLKSISRRWLYNVPRSGATEGMRPLGRLALLDHASAVNAGLQDAIARLLAETGDQAPSIYVVGSLAGGTGSGMFIDVAYRMRKLLDEGGLQDVEILSLLTTARMQGDPSRPLVLHDTNAAIQEIKYFLQPENSYPGDAGVDWPGMPAARTPLHKTYLIAESQALHAPSPIQILVDYLWIDATGARSLLDSARRFDHDEQNSAAAQPTLRSVGVVQLSGTRRLEANVLAPSTTRHLLRRWLGNPERSNQSAQPLVERVNRHCQLSAEEMYQKVLHAFGHDADVRCAAIMSHLKRLRVDDVDDQALVAFVRSTLGREDSEIDAETALNKLQRDMATRLIDGRLDFAAAIRSAQMMASQMRSVIDQLTEAAELPPPATAGISKRTVEAICARAERIVHATAAHIAAKRAKRIHESLSLFEQKLSIRAMVIAKAIRSVNDGKKGGSSAWDDMDAPIRGQSEQVIKELHSLTAPEWLVKLIGEGGGSVSPEQLVSVVCQAAVPLVCNAVRVANGEVNDDSNITKSGAVSENSHAISNTTRFGPRGAESIGATASLAELAAQTGSTTSAAASVLTIEEAIEAVRPALLSCGGYQRLILIVGSKAEQDLLEPQVQQYHQGSLTTVVIDSAPPMLIHEAQRIVIDDVARRLTDLAGGNDQICRRLTSRSDIDWTSTSSQGCQANLNGT